MTMKKVPELSESSPVASKSKIKRGSIAGQIPRQREQSARSRNFVSEKLIKVNSRWKPLTKPSLHPMRDGVTFMAEKEKRKAEREQLGLPRNVQPVIINTKFQQYKLSHEDLMKGCSTERDRRFMKVFANHNRLMPIDRWKRYTLVHGKVFNHDLGVFLALDLALATVALNFYRDMRALLAGRRKKVRVSDVNYLINNVWSRQASETAKIYWPDAGLSKSAYTASTPRSVNVNDNDDGDEKGADVNMDDEDSDGYQDNLEMPELSADDDDNDA